METTQEYQRVNYVDSLAFGRNQENRKIRHTHVASIKKQYAQCSERFPAITVNAQTNNIIDGQHRLKAFQELVKDERIPSDSTIRVMYVDIPQDEEVAAIIDANTHSLNWSLDDYINSYVQAGNAKYIELDAWCKNHTLTCNNGKPKYRYGASIITGKGCSKALQEGVFTFKQEELDKADEVHAEMVEIADLLHVSGKGAWIESLAISWSEVRHFHPFKTWMKELKHKKQSLLKLPKSNAKEWNAIFSQVHLAIDKKEE